MDDFDVMLTTIVWSVGITDEDVRCWLTNQAKWFVEHLNDEETIGFVERLSEPGLAIPDPMNAPLLPEIVSALESGQPMAH